MQLQNVPNDQVMAIFAMSPKTRIFWKSAKGGPREIFQKSPKKMPTFEKPQKHSGAKNIILLYSMHLKCKDCKRFWRKKRIQKFPNG